MSLRNKTIIIVGLTILSLIAILFASSQGILLSGFSKLETKDMQQKVENVQQDINTSLEQLDSIVLEYSAWDETYAYAMNERPQYVQTNITDTTMTQLHINLMLFVNTEGNVLYSRFQNIQHHHTEEGVPEFINDMIQPGGILTCLQNTKCSVQGLLELPDGPAIIVSRPITKNEFEGPILGYVVMGRYLADPEFDQLANAKGYEVKFYSLSLSAFSDRCK